MPAASIRARYIRILREHVEHPNESHLVEAAELGREMVHHEIPPEDIAELHSEAMEQLPAIQNSSFQELTRRVCEPLTELLIAYSMAFREQLENVKRAHEEHVLLRAKFLHQDKLASVGLLASGMAHEIGNPLSAIAAICDNQLRKTPEPAIAEKFQKIRLQVNRMTKIIRQLVTFARPGQSGPQATPINEVLEEALAMARLSRDANNVHVVLDLAADLPPALVAADQLAQVFLNLFLNAFDAMKDKPGELCVRTGRKSDGWLFASIKDNGCGIAPESMKKLFMPFFTTKEIGMGTGLGLHVSYGIVRDHGGEIRVESTPGEGTAFIVELPLDIRKA